MGHSLTLSMYYWQCNLKSITAVREAIPSTGNESGWLGDHAFFTKSDVRNQLDQFTQGFHG